MCFVAALAVGVWLPSDVRHVFFGLARKSYACKFAILIFTKSISLYTRSSTAAEGLLWKPFASMLPNFVPQSEIGIF